MILRTGTKTYCFRVDAVGSIMCLLQRLQLPGQCLHHLLCSLLPRLQVCNERIAASGRARPFITDLQGQQKYRRWLAACQQGAASTRAT